MVWLHPGGFKNKDAGPGSFGPQMFMDNDVILVTINYRLGILGFLTSGDTHAPGNLGLRDQALALDFVKAEAAAFMGDPDRITLFGAGAGGKAAIYQALSPLNRGKKLFRRLIVQSGSPLLDFNNAIPTGSHSEQVLAFGKMVGCKKSDIKVSIILK